MWNLSFLLNLSPPLVPPDFSPHPSVYPIPAQVQARESRFVRRRSWEKRPSLAKLHKNKTGLPPWEQDHPCLHLLACGLFPSSCNTFGRYPESIRCQYKTVSGTEMRPILRSSRSQPSGLSGSWTTIWMSADRRPRVSPHESRWYPHDLCRLWAYWSMWNSDTPDSISHSLVRWVPVCSNIPLSFSSSSRWQMR